MSVGVGALLVPELRWDRDHGFAHLDELIADALDLGVAGFVLRDAPAAEARSLSARLQRGSRHPLLLAADASAGAGGALPGCTGLPPQAALGALRDDGAIRRAARLTARELRAQGVNWALAPILDLAVQDVHPSLGANAFGADPQRVAEWGVAWIDACQAEGVMACARSLPGEGRVTADPTLEAASVDVGAASLWSTDLVPFRAAADSGVATMLVSQVSYPRLDTSRAGAATSRVVLEEMMRTELQYDGLLVAAPVPRAWVEAHESALAVSALVAGCDLLLAPQDLGAVAEALDRALDDGTLPLERVEAAVARQRFWAAWGQGGVAREATLDDVLWARQAADTVVHALRGVFANIGPIVDVILVDDDATQAWERPEHRLDPFLGTLRAVGLTPRVVAGPSDDGRGAVVVAVLGEPSAGRGRVGYAESTQAAVRGAVAAAREARRPVLGVLFGPPAWAAQFPELANVICAWSGSRAMQEAAARRVA